MLVSLKGLHKTYAGRGEPFHALKDINLEIDAGELVFVVGKSGSGKSTLMNMIAGLDRPTRGEVKVAGESVHALNEDELARFRGQNVGVVFQFFQLLPTLTALENVMLAMDFADRVPAKNRRAKALALLDRMGTGEQADKFPATLSGGQQQRVAIARALANDPPLLVADEPTGNLDSATAAHVLALFSELTGAGKTVIVVSHEKNPAVRPTRVVMIEDGTIVPSATEVSHAHRG